MSDDVRPAKVDSPGAALLAERRRQNLSLGDVARQLKLAVRQVEALERDDFGSFQSAVFVHGFLRNYAKLLGLDHNPLIQAADDLMHPPPPPEPEVPAAPARVPAVTASKSRWPLYTGVATVLIVGGLLALNSRSPAPPKSGPAVEREAPVARVKEEATEKRTVAAKPVAKPAAEKAVAEKPVEEKRAPENKPVADNTVESPAVAATSEVQSPAASTPPSDPDAPRMVVRMVFDQESWVEIKDRNGNTVFGQLNAAGTRRSASGEPPLSIVIGNAAGVHLFQGDKSVDLAPHTRVDVARLTLE